MPRSRVISCVFSLGLLSAIAQQPSATSPSSNTTIRSEARIVVLDVLATDKTGTPIHGLKAEDFALREDGAQQTIKSVEEHDGMRGTAAAPETASTPFDVHTNVPAAGAEVWNVVLFDQFNTPQADQQRARAQLVKFANALSPHTNVALVSFGGGLRIVSPFRAGQPGMLLALAKGALQFHQGPLLQPYNADEQFDLEQYLNKLPAQAARAMRDNRRETEMGQLDVRVQDTLAAFSAIAQWLGGYPGKKNVYWLSAGFPLTAEPQQFRGQDGAVASASYRKDYFELQQKVNQQMAAARIALFPLDVRGNMGGQREGIDTPDVKGAQYVEPGGGQLYSDDIGQDEARIGQEHLGMLDLARATGGVARFNRNDLADVLTAQFQQGQRFYSISYTPSNANYNGKYRRIDLAVADRENRHPAYRLSYRRGYFAVEVPAAPQNTIDRFTLALKRDAPPFSGVLFSSRFASHAKDGNASLVYTIDTSGLLFTPVADGGESASVDCAVVEYDTAGKLLGTSQIRVDGHVKAGQIDQVKKSGFPATQNFALAPGTAVLAVGVRDHTTGNFGTLHFPVAQ